MVRAVSQLSVHQLCCQYIISRQSQGGSLLFRQSGNQHMNTSCSLLLRVMVASQQTHVYGSAIWLGLATEMRMLTCCCVPGPAAWPLVSAWAAREA